MSQSNSPAKVTVSTSALPTGAATDGTDISSPTAMPSGGAGIRGWLSAIWTKLNGTVAVSLATNTPDVTDRSARLLGHVTVDTAPTTAVTLATNTPDVTDRAARLLGHVTVDTAPTTAITAAALPLPTGAAADGTLTGGTQKSIMRGGAKGTTTAADLTSLAVDANTQALHTSVTNFPATQPVSGTVTVTGTVTDNQGTANSVGNAWPVKNTDGTNTATVKAASTAAAAGDSGLVVALHPTSPLPAGTAVIGALSANQSVNNAQVNGAAVVTSVTGVQDVMPRKRTGATGLSPNYAAARITTKTTTNITGATAYVSTIVIACSAAGSAATLTVLDKSGTPKTIIPVFTLTVPTTGTPVVINFNEPILATGGIDVTTAGTTMGTVDVYVTYWQ